MRTAGKYLGVWVAIALVVGLVSFAFTFLGTIACALLVGMMMGALKGAKWFSFLVSLVFPAVIFSLTRNPQSELTPKQILILVTLSFGTFWGAYLVSALMFFCEQKDRKPPIAAAHASLPDTLAQGKPATVAEPPGESCLEQLQGNWVYEASNADEPQCKKVIQINQAKLELKAIDTSGRTTLLAQGEVTLECLQPSAPIGH